jgi:hypothetical protein
MMSSPSLSGLSLATETIAINYSTFAVDDIALMCGSQSIGDVFEQAQRAWQIERPLAEPI